MKSTIIFVRTMLIIAFPFFLICTLSRELITGFWRALRDTYHEIDILIEDFERTWKDVPTKVRADRKRRGLA